MVTVIVTCSLDMAFTHEYLGIKIMHTIIMIMMNISMLSNARGIENFSLIIHIIAEVMYAMRYFFFCMFWIMLGLSFGGLQLAY